MFDHQSKESIDIVDLGLGGHFMKSMHSLRSINSIKLDNYHAEIERSQNCQESYTEEPLRAQEKREFLRKGDKSRQYDPKRAI